MRDFFRMFIRMAMILFLVAGCVQNIYYLGELSKNSNAHQSRNDGYSNNVVDFDDFEETPSSQLDYEEEELLEHNRMTY